MFKEPYSELRWSFNREATWRPPTDVYETDDSAVVVVEIAGLREGDFEIALSGRTLTIGGVRHDQAAASPDQVHDHPAGKLTYQQMEIRYGRFRTQVYLPWAVDSGHTEARYDNGFLKVTLPKAQARRIPVAGANEVTATDASAVQASASETSTTEGSESEG